jgi:hypothetical protein
MENKQINNRMDMVVRDFGDKTGGVVAKEN